MKIVVIGGTGLIGSMVVEKLKQKGHRAIAAAPNTGVNTMTGEGLVNALAGAQIVVDVSNSPSFEEEAAMAFFQTSGRNIVAAEIAAGTRHHVALSVVGTERLQGSGYFRAKPAQEKLIKSSTIPYTLIHATRFFEFARSIAQASTVGKVVRLPHVLIQPMAAEDVAIVVAETALGEPANDTIEIGGPQIFTLDELIRKVLEYDNDSREVIADPDAPYYGVKLSEKTLVPDLGAHLASIRLDWWLSHVPAPQNPGRPAGSQEIRTTA